VHRCNDAQVWRCSGAPGLARSYCEILTPLRDLNCEIWWSWSAFYFSHSSDCGFNSSGGGSGGSGGLAVVRLLLWRLCAAISGLRGGGGLRGDGGLRGSGGLRESGGLRRSGGLKGSGGLTDNLSRRGVLRIPHLR
jgi:hypothetical protein